MKNVFVIWVCSVFLFIGCGGSTGSGVTNEKVQKGCVAACTAFSFTDCGDAVMRALPIGQILNAAADVADKISKCSEKCDQMQDILKKNGESLDIECLMSVSAGSKTQACEDVAVCLGVK